MSQKITSKNLAYDSTLPPFLAALRAQASGDPRPDPLLAAQRHSVKKRSRSEEAEDAPLVVDEHGNAIDMKVEKDGTVKEATADKIVDAALDDDAKERKPDKHEAEAKVGIGRRKRKAGKVIGDAANEPADKDNKPPSRRKVDREADALSNQKVKKKTKKVKLSFDDEEG